MKRLFRIKHEEELPDDPQEFVAETRPGIFAIVNSQGDRCSFGYDSLRALLLIEDIPEKMLEPVQE